MDVMHNRAISEQYFIWQVQERWTFLLYDMAVAHNGRKDMSQVYLYMSEKIAVIDRQHRET